MVAKTFEREIDAEFAVDPYKQVQVELGGDSLAVVIGGLQNARVFFQIHTDDKPTLRTSQRGKTPKQFRSAFRAKVANRRAREKDHAPPRWPSRPGDLEK